MPSETIDSSSFFSKELSFLDEGRLGFWKTDGMNKFCGAKADESLSPYNSPPLEERVQGNSLISNGFEHSNSYLNPDHRANALPDMFGPSDGADNHHEEKESFESLKELEAQTIGNLLPDDDDELFYGVSDAIDGKNRLTIRDWGLEVDGQAKPQTLGGNLNSSLGEPNSTTDERTLSEYPSRTLFVRNINSSIQDSEIQTLFGKYGDICTLYTTCKRQGFVVISYYDIRAACNAMNDLHNKPMQHRKLEIHFSFPKEIPSEKDVNQGTLVVSNLDSSVSNDELRQIFGVYGEVKEIREAPHRSHHKFIEFYDVRAADAALCALNRIDIAGNNIELEPSHQGGVKWSIHPFSSEIDQEHPGLHLHQSNSLSNIPLGYSGSNFRGGITSNLRNGTVLNSRSSGRPPMSPYWENAFSGARRSPSLPNLESLNYPLNSMEGSNPHSQFNFKMWGTSDFLSDRLPDCQGSFANGAICKSPGNKPIGRATSPSEHQEKLFGRVSPRGYPIEFNENGECMTVGRFARPSELPENSFGRISPREHPIEWNENVFSASPNGNCHSPGQHYMWRSTSPQPQGIMWPNSPSFVNGSCSPHPQQMQAISRPASHLPSGPVQMNNHPMGSPRSPSLWERRHGYAAEPSDTSAFNSGSLDGLSIPGTFPPVMNSMFPSGGSPMNSLHSPNLQLHPQDQRFLMMPTRGQLSPLLSPFQSPNERTRGRRNDGSSNQGDNKHFELDIDRIMHGEDKRTTLMIKNIPNKYTSKMLLAAIDECHKGTYDFLYLPIDFKNKCNVGYAFINMTDPFLIVPLYQALDGKKWEKFNSEKVASLAYARIQGKSALISHFQNSSLMNEDKRCRPMLFHTDGPNAGDQVPFPMGSNIRPRPNKLNSPSSEGHIQEIVPDSAEEKESSSGNSCPETSSARD